MLRIVKSRVLNHDDLAKLDPGLMFSALVKRLRCEHRYRMFKEVVRPHLRPVCGQRNRILC